VVDLFSETQIRPGKKSLSIHKHLTSPIPEQTDSCLRTRKGINQSVRVKIN